VSQDFKTLPPHPEYGNIYYPYRILDCGWLRYKVIDKENNALTGKVGWMDAISVTQWLNKGERPTAVDIIIDRSLKAEKEGKN
jgi:hypothetical protein